MTPGSMLTPFSNSISYIGSHPRNRRPGVKMKQATGPGITNRTYTWGRPSKGGHRLSDPRPVISSEEKKPPVTAAGALLPCTRIRTPSSKPIKRNNGLTTGGRPGAAAAN